MQLEGRTALVTGAGAPGGIGFEIAGALQREGAQVVISGRDRGRGEEAALKLGVGARFALADMTEVGQVRRLAEQAGEVDVLVNNAAGITSFSTAEQPLEEYEEVFAANVRGPYFLTASLVPGMIARGRGSIINISTVVARVATPRTSVYAASKAALESLTRTWAAEFGPYGIRVNTISPGPIASAKVLATVPEQIDRAGQGTPLARVGSTAEIAELALFLAGEGASYVTGACIPADGGRSAV